MHRAGPVQRLITGERPQATHLPVLPVSPARDGQDTDCVFSSKPPISIPRFLGNTTIMYIRGRGCATAGGGTFTVERDATGKWEEPKDVPVVEVPGGAFVPVFQITGDPYPVMTTVPGIPENPPSGFPAGITIVEVFVVEPSDSALLPGGRVLQLTKFHRSDTRNVSLSADGQRVVLIASANSLGTNPSHQYQNLSIDRLGGDLRQVTSFSAAEPGCTLSLGGPDRVTDSLLFGSTCNPLGLNPSGAEQAFAIRPDGSGLTQLTRTDGIVHHADGSVDVEIAGAFVRTRVQ